MLLKNDKNKFEIRRIVFLIISLFFLILFLIVDRKIILLLALATIIVMIISLKYPVVMVVLFTITEVWPALLRNTPTPFEPYIGVFRPSDLIVLLMVGAILYKIIFVRKIIRSTFSLLGLIILLFSLWNFYEIFRNYPLFGFSAPGEFRYRYLILAVPLYINLFFYSNKQRKNLFGFLIFSSLILPILIIPVIGSLKGWGVGPESRFFHASISLGLVIGLISLFIGKKYKLVYIHTIIVWIISIPILALILIDSHRSVWVAGVIGLIILFLLKEIQIQSLIRYFYVFFFIILIVIMVASLTGLDVFNYVVYRANEIFAPHQVTGGTAAWRLNQWNIALLSFKNSPIQGIGFGGYWETGVSPHSLYVQTLVKLGLVGMVLYAVIVFVLFLQMWHWIKINRNKNFPEISIVVVGLTTLFIGHAFYTVYAFEYYVWMFVGLAMSVVSWKK
jgi:O-antigen ligase